MGLKATVGYCRGACASGHGFCAFPPQPRPGHPGLCHCLWRWTTSTFIRCSQLRCGSWRTRNWPGRPRRGTGISSHVRSSPVPLPSSTARNSPSCRAARRVPLEQRTSSRRKQQRNRRGRQRQRQQPGQPRSTTATAPSDTAHQPHRQQRPHGCELRRPAVLPAAATPLHGPSKHRLPKQRRPRSPIPPLEPSRGVLCRRPAPLCHDIPRGRHRRARGRQAATTWQHGRKHTTAHVPGKARPDVPQRWQRTGQRPGQPKWVNRCGAGDGHGRGRSSRGRRLRPWHAHQRCGGGTRRQRWHRFGSVDCDTEASGRMG